MSLPYPQSWLEYVGCHLESDLLDSLLKSTVKYL
jgi:hypothetical protein